MKLPSPVYEVEFLKRYKRFFADVIVDGKTVVAHVPNTGSMKSCLEPKALCRVSYNEDPARKLKYTLQTIKSSTGWVGVNTSLTNDLVWEAWQKQKIAHLKDFKFAKKEVKISDETRLDMALWKEDLKIDTSKKIDEKLFKKHQFHFVEIKNVSLFVDGMAQFPDAVTTRGQKHLEELMALKKRGHEAEIIFVVQRENVKKFRAASDIDPTYAKLLEKAHKAGVIISVFDCKITKDEILIANQNVACVF